MSFLPLYLLPARSLQETNYARRLCAMSTTTSNVRRIDFGSGAVGTNAQTPANSSATSDTSTRRDKQNNQPGLGDEVAAKKLADEWVPTDGVGYEWVFKYAMDRYASMHSAFKELEDKAASIVTYLTSGVGILTIGALAAIAEGKIDKSVLKCSLPAIGCAVAALVCALLSRRTMSTYYLPPIDGAMQLANHAITEERGKAIFAAQAHLCVTMMKPVLKRKAGFIELSMRLAVVSVVLMVIPVLVAIYS